MLKIITIFLALLTLAACSSTEVAPVDNAWNNVASTQKFHKVQSGETIYSIAWRYGLSYQDLAKWNNLSAPYYLNIGQKLRLVPAKAGNSVSPTEAAPIAATTAFTPVSSTSTSATSKATTATLPAAKAVAKPAVTKKAATVAATTDEPTDLDSMNANASSAPVTSNGSNWPWPVKGKIIANFDEAGNKGVDIAVPAGTPVKAVQDGTVVYAGSNLHGYGQLLIIKQKDDILTAYAHNSRLLANEGAQVKKGQTIAMSGDTEASRSMLHFEVRKAGKPVNPMPYLNQSH